MRRLAIICAGLMLAACQPGKGGLPGPPSLTDASAAATQASAKFISLAQGSAASGQVPRASDPTAGPLLDTVFNTSALPAAPPPFSDIDPVNNWLLAVAKTGQVFILAGTGATDASGAASPAVAAKADQNLIAYAPEVGRYLDAEMTLLGEECAMIAQFTAANPDALKDPVRAGGLEKVKSGVTQTIASTLSVLAERGPADAWKEARAKVLVAMAPRAAQILPAADRQSLQSLAQQAVAQVTDPALKADLTEFAAKIRPA